MGRVSGKVALVTGGGSGLGRATSIMLAREGARVVVTDINEAGAQETAAMIGEGALALQHDVTDEQRWQDVLAETKATFGGLNILVNNAGIGDGSDVEHTDFATWKRVHAIDLDSVFLGCKYAISYMEETEGLGSIVNISSIAGIIAGHNMAAYNSAKAGVRHLSKSVALHCARKKNGIRCNSVHPTFVKTPILDDILKQAGREEGYAKLARQIPIGHLGEPDDIAYGILYLASDESRFMTGAELVLDGGISAM
ncbi:SDR family oxidoreductase [Sneathiella chinensis]|uniref:Short-chain dehydrogenase n=1 Tax=Sneathiella chinensis TaxID=349750 RepID=A0ABQ5U720_9PROT|nr:SDR family oxidoreductase [Sneathiella chinensis]GLQ07912.1 short-chain dehydrogenase [Sneathiella chinensis]